MMVGTAWARWALLAVLSAGFLAHLWDKTRDDKKNNWTNKRGRIHQNLSEGRSKHSRRNKADNTQALRVISSFRSMNRSHWI